MRDLVEGQVEPGEHGGLGQEVVDGPEEVVEVLDVVVAEAQRAAGVLPVRVPPQSPQTPGGLQLPRF